MQKSAATPRSSPRAGAASTDAEERRNTSTLRGSGRDCFRAGPGAACACVLPDQPSRPEEGKEGRVWSECLPSSALRTRTACATGAQYLPPAIFLCPRLYLLVGLAGGLCAPGANGRCEGLGPLSWAASAPLPQRDTSCIPSSWSSVELFSVLTVCKIKLVASSVLTHGDRTWY